MRSSILSSVVSFVFKRMPFLVWYLFKQWRHEEYLLSTSPFTRKTGQLLTYHTDYTLVCLFSEGWRQITDCKRKEMETET